MRFTALYLHPGALCEEQHLHATPIPLQIPHDLFTMDKDSGRSLLHGEDSAEAMMSSVRYQRDSLNETESLCAMERGAEPGGVWPHLLLDFIGQQNKFKGRTRKNVRGRGTQEKPGKRWRCRWDEEMK